jgi:predicted TPR repeat methyltransferase
LPLLSTLILTSGDLVADRRYAWAQDLEEKGDIQGAAEVMEQALELTPHFATGWFALARLKEKLGQTAAAAAAYQKTREADPEDRQGALLGLVRLRAAEASGMPAAYVRTLFDQYAPQFDESLLQGLSYSGPAQLLEAVEAAAGGRRFHALLDLGCGTGLGAAAFRDKADRLVGVDLSPRMVEQARQKQIYDRLAVGDLLEFLVREKAEGEEYDLILAADVFAYFPDVAPIAAAAAAVLAQSGVFAFSVERHDSDANATELGEGLRYAHSATHVRAALEKADLTVARLNSASTRSEKGFPVPGLIAVASKT